MDFDRVAPPVVPFLKIDQFGDLRGAHGVGKTKAHTEQVDALLFRVSLRKGEARGKPETGGSQRKEGIGGRRLLGVQIQQSVL